MKKRVLSMLLVAMLMPVVMHAQINNVTVIETDTNACEHFTWDVNNVTYTVGGVFSYVSNDTVFVLDLTLGHATVNTISTPVESGCSYTWGDTTYTQSGVYTRTFTSAAGCDSTVTLTININPKHYEVLYDTACESTVWYGMTLSRDTTVSIDTVINGCEDSIVLNLTIRMPEFRSDTLNVTVCDQYYYEFVLGQNGFRTTRSLDTNTNALSNSSASMRNVFHPRTMERCFDSTFYLNITVNHSSYTPVSYQGCDEVRFTVGNKDYSYIYTRMDTLKRVALNQEKCDSNVVVNVTVYKTPVITVAGDLQVAPNSNATLHASSDQQNIKWQWSNGATTDSITLTNINTNTDISVTGTSTVSGCSNTNSITILCNVGIDEAAGNDIRLYPNPASDRIHVESAEAVKSIVIYNAVGQQMYKGNNLGNAATLDVANLSIGTYVMSIMLADGTHTTRTLVVAK